MPDPLSVLRLHPGLLRSIVAEAPAPPACWGCRGAIDAADNFCRHCGAGLGDRVPWYYEPTWVAALALLALGPFVLPLIWRSPKFTERGRRIATALTVALGVYQVWATYQGYRVFKRLMASVLQLNA